ncbi:MAG: hypothetical protein JZU65_10725 [Chlorobium sp.]|nr:hypothetical protein [Chlorobium sp.]
MFNLIEILLSFFKEFFNTLVNVCVDIFVLILDGTLALLAYLIQMMATIMPSLSIGVELINQFPTPTTAICWLTWLFPVDVLFQCTQFYITLYLLKFMSNPILRFPKIVR